MAILEGFQVAIVVDGKDLKEFAKDNTEDTSSTAFRYVESVPETAYSVRFSISKKFSERKEIAGCVIILYVDGMKADLQLWSNNGSRNGGSFAASYDCVDAVWFKRSMRFAKTVIGQ